MKSTSVALPPLPIAWTIAAFLLAALPHLLSMPPLLGVLALTLCSWRVLAALRRWRLPPAWLRLLLTLGIIALLVASLGGLWGRRGATALLCLMLAAKMLELKRLRDMRMVASVSLFLIASQFLFSERFIFIAYLFGGVMLVFCALLQIQRLELGQLEKPLPSRTLAKQAAALMLTALPMALILFVAFPRLAEPLWGLPDRVMDGKTGLSDSMSPGSIANLYIDDSPAFRAEFNGVPPPPQQRYWRGPVLWRFDGDTWERAYLPSRTQAKQVAPGSDDYRYTVQLEPHERRWLFALDYPVVEPDNAGISMDFQIVRRHPVTTLTEYAMRSNPHFTDMPRLPETIRRLALQLPEERNPRTREMATKLRRQFDSDQALIEHVLTWLREEPFFYSLDTAPLGRHSADEFLFDLREGYCEYYASAFAVIMRAANIPTRIVTGYQGGYWQAGGEYLLVRQSDAHAWVEVWLAGSGWTRVDPTAAVSPARIESGARSVTGGGGMDWLLMLRNRYDRLQHVWNSWVLGFNAARQQRMFHFMGLPDLSRAALTLIMTTVIGLLVGLLAWFWLARPVRSLDPVVRAWQRLQQRLHRRALGPSTGETPLAWAERVAPDLREGQRLRELAELYCRLHYGNLDDSERRAYFIRAVRRLPLTPPLEPRGRVGV